jgi:hypothetical protein
MAMRRQLLLFSLLAFLPGSLMAESKDKEKMYHVGDAGVTPPRLISSSQPQTQRTPDLRDDKDKKRIYKDGTVWLQGYVGTDEVSCPESSTLA